MRKLFVVASLLLVCLFTAARTDAAEVTVTFDGTCDITLRGDIEPGDLKRLEEAFEKDHLHPRAPKDRVERILCLHSPRGGSFQEAIRVIKWLIGAGPVTTLVNANDECVSACALIFMFGHTDEGDLLMSPNRQLHVLGKLGFHSPHIGTAIDTGKPEIAAAAYRAGILAIGRLLEADWDDWFPKSLLIEMLKREAHEFLFVDTVGRAAAWNIDLKDWRRPTQITEAMIERACLNRARDARRRWSGRWWGAGDEETGQREAIKSPERAVVLKNGHRRIAIPGFGAEDGYSCVVDVYDRGDRNFLLDIHMGENERDPELPKPLNPRAKDFFLNGVPTWYVYDYKTRLEDIAQAKK